MPIIPDAPVPAYTPLTDRATRLRDAMILMVSRYGRATRALGAARNVPQDELDRLMRVCSRRFAAVQRLTRALAALDTTGSAR